MVINVFMDGGLKAGLKAEKDIKEKEWREICDSWRETDGIPQMSQGEDRGGMQRLVSLVIGSTTSAHVVVCLEVHLKYLDCDHHGQEFHRSNWNM